MPSLFSCIKQAPRVITLKKGVFIVEKKWRIVVFPRKVRVILSMVLIVLGLITTGFGRRDFLRPEETVAEPLGNKVILIDPGHGGIDAGASDGDAIEKDLNLEISMILKSYIESNGGICYMTRNEDKNTADPNRPKNVSQKMSDLKTRKSDIERVEADIFVSIHMNKFSQAKYRGLQVFYDGSSQQSKMLGEIIQETVKTTIKDGNTRKAKATGDKIYVLKGNAVPSVLVECGFLSNQEERELLKSPKYQQKIAWGIYLGIINYFDKTKM